MNEQNMLQAINAVREGRMKLRHAALQFGVAKSTLSDRLCNRYKRTGSCQLTNEEEQSLIKYMQYMSKYGFPMTRAMARRFIIEIVKASGRPTKFNMDTGPTDQWFRHFLERNHDLKEKMPLEQKRRRASMSNLEVKEEYFTMLDEVLQENNLQDKPSQIFHCDETGWNGKEASKIKVTGDDHVTAVLCVCADGHFLPATVIFKDALPYSNYSDGIPDEWAFATSESGSMDTPLFPLWFEEIFLPNCGSERPVVLIMDNHDSNVSLALIEKALANDVILLGIPSDPILLPLPLDVKLIGPLKPRFTTIADNLGFTSTNTSAGKSKFPIILKYAIDQVAPTSIQDAFEVTGLYPCNRRTISDSKLVSPYLSSERKEACKNVEIRACGICGSLMKDCLVSQVPESLATILTSPSGDLSPFADILPELVPNTRKRKAQCETKVLTGCNVLQAKEKNIKKAKRCKYVKGKGKGKVKKESATIQIETDEVMSELQETDEVVRELQETDEVVRELQETDEVVRELQETDEVMSELQETDEVVRELQETDEVVRKLQETDKVVRELQETDEVVRELQETDEVVRELQETDEVVRELQETDEVVRELQETDEVVRELQETDEVVRELQETDEVVRELQETDEVVRELQETDEVVRELQETDEVWLGVLCI